MKKRGITPVLVLIYLLALVGLASILFLVVLPQFEQELEEGATTAISCSPMILGFDVKHACSVANEVQLTVENNREQNIESFSIKVYGDKDVYESFTDTGLSGFAVQKLYSNYDLGHTGRLNKIEIYPLLKSGSKIAKCSNIAFKLKGLAECTTGCITCKTKEEICETAARDDLCDGLDMLYGLGCRSACCTEHGLCCG